MHGFDALPCLVQVSPSASTPCVSFWLRLHAECCLCEHERMKRSCWKRNKLCVIDWPRFCYFHDSSSFWGVALEQHSLTVFPMSLIHDGFSDFITATKKKTKQLQMANSQSSLSCQLWRYSFSIQDQPPHLPTRWRTAPRERKLRRRQSEEVAPLQVKLSQTGRWGTEANGSQWQEGGVYVLCYGYKLVSALRGRIEPHRRTPSCHGSNFRRGLEDSHQDTARHRLHQPEFHQLTQLKPTLLLTRVPTKEFAQNRVKGRFVLVFELQLKCLFQLGCN